MRCQSCGFESHPEHRFCAMCGQRLAGGELAERRSLTVLFCDLVGSTALSTRLDPEDLRELVRQYQRAAAAVVERLEGYIAQFLGDGLLIYFGYPVAHEDDAQRAVRCALELLESVPSSLQLRLGAHTGTVVVGEMGGGWRRERLAIGDVPNLAARLQSLAEPGTLLVSETTRDLCAEQFHTESLGDVLLKGLAREVSVHRVVGRRSAAVRLAPTSFVGRGRELQVLEALWEQVQAGAFRRVNLVGEPGLGKSRLLATFCERRQAPVLLAQCSPYAVDHPFFPVKEWLRAILGLPLTPTMEEVRAALPPGPLLELLSPVPSTRFELGEILAHLTGFLTEFCDTRSALLVLEDAHWIDLSSRLLLTRLEGLNALLLVSGRSLSEPGGEVIQLQPMPAEQMEVLFQTLLPDLTPASCQELARRCDGNPLFAEELARSTRAGQSELPTSLQGLLLSRLDQLPASRRLAQVASVIGRHFPLAVLEALWEASLEPALSELVEAGVLERWGASAGFRHALMQEAAYQTLLHRDRQQLHLALACVLERDFPALARTRPEMLAHHYSQARELERASSLWEEAARQCVGRGANAEALRHLDRALEGVDQPQRELSLIGQRIAPLIGTEGYASEQVAAIAARARELSQTLGHVPFPVLRGLWAYHLVRAQLGEACELASRLRCLAVEGPPGWMVEAELATGITAAHMGDVEASRRHLGRSLQLMGPPDPEAVRLYGQDPAVLGRAHLAWQLALQGQVEAARQELRRLRARSLIHPFSHIIARVFTATVAHLLGQFRTTLRAAAQARELSARHDSRHWLGLATGLEGWARARLGQSEEGLLLVREGYRIRFESGARVSLPHLKLLEADCLVQSGRVEEAVTAARLGLEIAEAQGEPAYSSRLRELIRAHG